GRLRFGRGGWPAFGGAWLLSRANPKNRAIGRPRRSLRGALDADMWHLLRNQTGNQKRAAAAAVLGLAVLVNSGVPAASTGAASASTPGWEATARRSSLLWGSLKNS